MALSVPSFRDILVAGHGPREELDALSILSLFVDMSQAVITPWYKLRLDGDADADAMKERFAVIASQDTVRLSARFQPAQRRFANMQGTSVADGKGLHDQGPVIGGASLYGGWNRRPLAMHVLDGPSWFGEDVTFALVSISVGPSIYGNRVKLGSGAKVFRTVLGHDVKVNGNSYVSGSVIGEGSRICPGCVLYQEPKVAVDSIKIPDFRTGLYGEPLVYDTGRKQFGCALPPYTVVGANTVILPGVILTEPGIVIPDGALVKPGIYDRSAILRMYGDDL
ncbi:MAG: hypothetical protein WCV84_05355 [Patescibacteria group bacterium]